MFKCLCVVSKLSHSPHPTLLSEYYTEVPSSSDTQAHKHKYLHKQLELNEAELSLVPISLIINNFSQTPNTLSNLQRNVCVSVV